MSLLVWLPLNGDLHNQGLSNVTTTVNGTTSYTNGKIGQALSANGSSFWNIVGVTLGDEASLCCWTKTSTNGKMSWSMIASSSNKLNLYESNIYTLNTGDSNNNPFLDDDNNTISCLHDGQWHHFVITFGSSIAKLYIDGQYAGKAKTFKSPATTSAQTVRLGGGYNNAHSYDWNGQLNDFRIYDHCLSAKEIKEIAKGLVLHYKLDNNSLGGENFLGNSNAAKTSIAPWGNWGTVTSRTIEQINGKSWFHLVANGSNYGGYSQNSYSRTGYDDVNFKPNTDYTISATWFASANANCRFWFHMRSSEGGNNISQPLKDLLVTTTPTRFSFTFNSGSNPNYTINRFCIMMGTLGSTPSGTDVYFTDVKMEEGVVATPWSPAPKDSGIDTSVIYDVSGYNRSASINGPITYKASSPRYTVSTHLDGDTSCIIVPFNSTCPDNIFTLNLWFKKDALGSKGYETLFGGPSGFEMDTRAGSATTLSLYMASTRGGNVFSPFNLGEWYMVTMVRDGTNELYYVNGELKKTIEAKAMPTGTYRIGAWNGNEKQNYYGEMSDFRIYNTVLSTEDIKELYETSASIDNKGNTYTREAIETPEDISINARGQMKVAEFDDGISSASLTKTNISKSNTLYEY